VLRRERGENEFCYEEEEEEREKGFEGFVCPRFFGSRFFWVHWARDPMRAGPFVLSLNGRLPRLSIVLVAAVVAARG